MNAHEIDYEIFGEEMQYVSIELDPQEAVVAEAGGFMMSEPDIKMETIFGDGSHKEKQGGILDKVLSAGKRILTGESLFMTVFYNMGQGKRSVSFASPYPGKIMPIDLSEKGGKFICQKDAFLCAAKGVSVGIEFSKRLGRGFFGGEGFIMQKLEGTVWRLFMPAVPWLARNWPQGKFCGSIRVAWWASHRLWITMLNLWVVFEIPYLGGKVFSSPP